MVTEVADPIVAVEGLEGPALGLERCLGGWANGDGTSGWPWGTLEAEVYLDEFKATQGGTSSRLPQHVKGRKVLPSVGGLR